MTTAPDPPAFQLSIGVTGHRAGNASFSANRDAIEAMLHRLFELIGEASTPAAPVRLHSLLSEGVDQLAARGALAREWELVAPLPFGHNLNVAINSAPLTAEDALALIRGENVEDAAIQARAEAIRDLCLKARCFELAERDVLLARLFCSKLASPSDLVAAQAFSARCSARVALAGRILIEQSDLVIGVWDGVSRAFVGGTGHTISAALDHGTPVIWIDAGNPGRWRVLGAPEALASETGTGQAENEVELRRIVQQALACDGDNGAATLVEERWKPRSSRLWTGYRRVEALFGEEGRPLRSLAKAYEAPDAIATGSAAPMLAAARGLPGNDPRLIDRIERTVLPLFAWVDGISAWLSDSYRGGMTVSFLLSALAVVVGILYQPLAASDQKWTFATIEFLLLSLILLITWLGGKWRWHGRWFETRRVAEYLRHAPILLMLGVARAPGRWPKGGDVNWPELNARHILRGCGLPRMAMTSAYLRQGLQTLLLPHVVAQRDYHLEKARRLSAVHHNLDRLSTRLFQLAVASVAGYLLLKLAALGLVPEHWPHSASYLFTFLGVALPTFGAAIAGIRYFGDFERFAAISEVTAAKLEGIRSRIALLLAAPDDRLDYARVSELVHATDDVVVSEIENWQAVFGGKHITVPV